MIDGGDAITWMTWIVFAGFLLDWLAILFDWQKIKPLSKSLAMFLLLLWTLTAAALRPDVFVGLLLLAQTFGMAGDIFLLSPNRWFIWGLGSFLLGHVTYLGLLFLLLDGFHRAGDLSTNLVGLLVLCVVMCGVILSAFYWCLNPVVLVNKIRKSLWIAVQIYAWIISGMVAFSLLFVLVVPAVSWKGAAILAGSLLFLTSDFLLAYDRFVCKLERGRLFVRITYHLAQFNLAWGFMAVFLEVGK